MTVYNIPTVVNHVADIPLRQKDWLQHGRAAVKQCIKEMVPTIGHVTSHSLTENKEMDVKWKTNEAGSRVVSRCLGAWCMRI